jgi:hypothetical protein
VEEFYYTAKYVNGSWSPGDVDPDEIEPNSPLLNTGGVDDQFHFEKILDETKV